MKKQTLIIFGAILLIGIISVVLASDLGLISFHPTNLEVTLTTAEKQILQNKSINSFTLGNISCFSNICYIDILNNKKLFTKGYFKLNKNVNDYSEVDFIKARNTAVEQAIKRKLNQIKPIYQKINASGNVTIK